MAKTGYPFSRFCLYHKAQKGFRRGSGKVEVWQQKGFRRGSGKVEVWQQKGSGVAGVRLRCGSKRVQAWQW